MPVGLDASNPQCSSLGAKGGSSKVTLTSANLPPHPHTCQLAAGGSHAHTVGATSSDDVSHAHWIWFALYQTGSYLLSWNTLGALWYGTTYTTAPTSTAGGHSHTFTTDTQGDHQHTVTTGNGPGLAQAIDVTNPFITVNFVIKA